MTGWRVERAEDGEAVLTFGGLPFGQGFGLVASLGEQAPPAYAALVKCVIDAARLRSLAATFDNHLNRDRVYLVTGAQVAAMLRDGGE